MRKVPISPLYPSVFSQARAVFHHWVSRWRIWLSPVSPTAVRQKAVLPKASLQEGNTDGEISSWGKGCTSHGKRAARVMHWLDVVNMAKTRGLQLQRTMALPKGADGQKCKCEKALEVMKGSNGKWWRMGGTWQLTGESWAPFGFLFSYRCGWKFQWN